MVGLMMVVLGISSQANAYVLVYNLFGMVQAVDTTASSQVTQLLNGYIVINVSDDDGTVTDSSVILYGRQGWNNKFYTVGDNIVNFTAYGNFVTLIADNGSGDKIILTGQLRNTNIGTSSRQLIANMLNGAMTLQNGQLFDTNASLVGAGAIQATLNGWFTRGTNSASTAFGDVVNSITSNLESRGFQLVGNPVEPPPADDGNEPAPT